MVSGGNYVIEAFILGSCIYWDLTCVDVEVTVNVTDKPIINSVENVEGYKFGD